jgi:putative phosphonate metabolism protein
MTTDNTTVPEGYSFGDARYAIYTVPLLDSPLRVLGNAWLGRDPDIDEPVPHPVVEGITGERLQQITHSPRQYGFHGTLKAPFGLAPGQEAGALRDAVDAFAGARDPLEVRLKVGSIDGFVALVPAEPSPELDRLAADCVRDLDRFRAPLTDEERARRNPERLSERQREYLERWGYPYVLEEFGFHMTLTGRLDEPERGRVRAILERMFAPVLGEPLRVDQVALFTQTHRVAPFRVADRFRFRR